MIDALRRHAVRAGTPQTRVACSIEKGLRALEMQEKGFPYAKIVFELGISEGTLWGLLRRTRKRLEGARLAARRRQETLRSRRKDSI